VSDSELRVNVTRDGRFDRARLARARPRVARRCRRSAPARPCGLCRTTSARTTASFACSGPAGATRATTYAGGTRAQLVIFDRWFAWRHVPRDTDTVYDACPTRDRRVLRRVNMVKSDARHRSGIAFPAGTARGIAVDFQTAGWLGAGATLSAY
jgi:hypothetical protein